MSIKRGLNKKAQEGGISFFTIGIVVAVVLAAIVIIAINFGGERGGDAIEQLPEKLQLIASRCIINAEAGLDVDFCRFDEIELEGQEQFVNCKSPRLEKILQDAQAEKGFDTPPSCIEEREEFCKSNLVDKDTLVNGRVCEDIGEIEIQVNGAPETTTLGTPFTLRILAQTKFENGDTTPLTNKALEIIVSSGSVRPTEPITNNNGVAEVEVTPTTEGTITIRVQLENEPNTSTEAIEVEVTTAEA